MSINIEVRDQVFDYCDERVAEGEQVTMWHVYNHFEIDWVEAAIHYGYWVNQRSEEMESSGGGFVP